MTDAPISIAVPTLARQVSFARRVTSTESLAFALGFAKCDRENARSRRAARRAESLV